MMEEDILAACDRANIIVDVRQGLNEISPGVIMVYGVKRNYALRVGRGRQRKYICVLTGDTISVEDYEN